MSKYYMVLGAVLTVFMVIIAAYTMSLYGTIFPEPAMSEEQLVNTTSEGEIIHAMSEFLWDYRGLDLLMQAIVLFATAIGCTAMLRVIRGIS